MAREDEQEGHGEMVEVEREESLVFVARCRSCVRSETIFKVLVGPGEGNGETGRRDEEVWELSRCPVLQEPHIPVRAISGDNEET